MVSIEDIKKLLESKSFTSARDLDELEEKPDDKQNEVRLNCEPMVGVMEEEGKIFLNSVRFSKAWNSLGKDIPIKQGNAFPLGQGDVLDIDTGVWASFPDNTIGVLMMLPSFTGDTGLTLVGSPFVSSNNGNIMIRVTNVRKDMAIVEKDKHIAELIIVGKIKADILELIKVMNMFGLKIVKSSYINTLNQDLDEAISYSSRLKRDYEDSRKKITELEEKVGYLETLSDSLNMDIEQKDSIIIKMGNELSKSREIYNESVKDKETLKRAYMDIEKKHKLSSKLLDEARRRYKELEDQNRAMSDRIKYLENYIDPEALDSDVPYEVVVDEDKMDPNSGHIDIHENNASEVADAGNDVNVENKAEDKKKSKKRKKSKKSE